MTRRTGPTVARPERHHRSLGASTEIDDPPIFECIRGSRGDASLTLPDTHACSSHTTSPPLHQPHRHGSTRQRPTRSRATRLIQLSGGQLSGLSGTALRQRVPARTSDCKTRRAIHGMFTSRQASSPPPASASAARRPLDLSVVRLCLSFQPAPQLPRGGRRGGRISYRRSRRCAKCGRLTSQDDCAAQLPFGGRSTCTACVRHW
jgi:hypothetical protein